MKKSISDFHKSFYIPEIQKLVFHIPHVQILGTINCGDSRWTSLKLRESFKDVLCRFYYAESVVDSFPIKYNQNTTAEIDPHLLRVFHWNISVHYLSQE